ncbi:fimbria/pilus periplasmic chaperone [Ramlibacter sp.]|uniref:fimbrial biogenesis chaperone n=1 Tax=Ramlibacter sp. TaxID=1917967 RepID=UPI0018217FB9|nr:fimbria/pilus periplasmic chaperone [Ramlibacter sp.]MBA2673168.1 molecular chaperone [Ramlibacter sp.]
MTVASRAGWRRSLLRLGAALALGLAAGTAGAQLIAPVLVELSAARRVASVTLSNNSDRPMTFQAQALAWEQVEGADRYAESADLLVVPPVANVAPGASQIFRVALRRQPPAQELAYRLILEDVTTETAPSTGDSAAVRLQFRHSLPVFVGTREKTQHHAQLVRCAAAPACVRLDNQGGKRVKLLKLVATGTGWQREIGSPATVLTDRWKQWTLDPPASAGAVTVTAETTAGALSVELPPRLR